MTDRSWSQLEELREQMVEASRGLQPGDSLLAFASRLGSILAEGSRIGRSSTHQDSPKVPGEKHAEQERQWEREEDQRERDLAEAEMQEELRGGA